MKNNMPAARPIRANSSPTSIWIALPLLFDRDLGGLAAISTHLQMRRLVGEYITFRVLLYKYSMDVSGFVWAITSQLGRGNALNFFIAGGRWLENAEFFEKIAFGIGLEHKSI